jgi:dihydroorotate dehydrogenase (fumarate)
MTTLSTDFIGIHLRNPIIVSSSGLTNSVAKIIDLEKAGAGAVVLKSLFEEQIKMEAGSMIDDASHPEAEDYINNYLRSNSLDQYLKLIEDSKSSVTIPVIASINCFSSKEWMSFAQGIQEAGADALELNVFIFPRSIHDSSEHIEQLYTDILNEVIQRVTIPVCVKLGSHITNIPALVNRLYGRGAKGVTLFNRFYSPDIDVNSMSFISSKVLSDPSDISHSLRWTSIVSSLVEGIDVCASTGVHDGNAVIKQILAGAKAVQICSVLYKNGSQYIVKMLDDVKNWMEKNNFNDLPQFRSRMSYKNLSNPEVFERAQFMKYFSDINQPF